MTISKISMIKATVNPNARYVANAFSNADMLEELVTTIAYDPNGRIAHLLSGLPKSWREQLYAELGRRTWTLPKAGVIRRHIVREILRLMLDKLHFTEIGKGQPRNLVDWVYSELDDHFAHQHLKDIAAVYAYEDEAATTFQAAHKRGILCLYDLPSVYYPKRQQIEQAEAERFPELASLFQIVQDAKSKLERKTLEVQLADHIFVASSINKRALIENGIPNSKISVIPYGAPIEYFRPLPKTDEIFRVIYVGKIAPHKGIHYLLQAWKNLSLPHAELLLIGNNLFPEHWLNKYKDVFRYIPSVPHFSLNQYYNNANVLVFPSLIEGFGLVMLEAMACGVPVITTTETGGPDILTDGIEGFTIPSRNVESIAERIEWCYHNTDQLRQMGELARRKAEQLTWENYSNRMVTQVYDLLNRHSVVN